MAILTTETVPGGPGETAQWLTVLAALAEV